MNLATLSNSFSSVMVFAHAGKKKTDYDSPDELSGDERTRRALARREQGVRPLRKIKGKTSVGADKSYDIPHGRAMRPSPKKDPSKKTFEYGNPDHALPGKPHKERKKGKKGKDFDAADDLLSLEFKKTRLGAKKINL